MILVISRAKPNLNLNLNLRTTKSGLWNEVLGRTVSALVPGKKQEGE